MTEHPDTSASRSRSPSIATFLSFLWPGLGQWYAGRPRAALLFALPVGAALAVVGFLVDWSPNTLAARLLSPRFSIALLVLVALAGVLRLLAMADALWTAARQPRRWWRRPAPLLFILLSVVVVSAHVAAGNVVWSFYRASSAIFVVDPSAAPVTPTPSPDPAITPHPEATPTAPEPTVEVTPVPPPDSRLTVLFVGRDFAPGRTHALTDTLLVATVDPLTEEVAMISFPRDIARFPLTDGTTYEAKINTLLSHFERDPDPFGMAPLSELTRELGNLLGIEIDYYASIDLRGFERMIDLVGGVDIVNPREIADPSYGVDGFYLPAGPAHLDGATALKYVRSRMGAGDNDFTRARRQQQVLVALQQRLRDPLVLGRLPEVLDAASETVRTNYPADRAGEILGLAELVDDPHVRGYVLGPRRFAERPPPEETGGLYLLELKLDAVEELSIEIFGSDSRYFSTSAP
ncbi:hypothetical protein BH20CHL6_BH20CHL6_17870 [soil metagenome]